MTAETASHFVGALNRSPAHPVSIKANGRTMIFIRTGYPNCASIGGLTFIPSRRHRRRRALSFENVAGTDAENSGY
jgi:hypothetical protein